MGRSGFWVKGPEGNQRDTRFDFPLLRRHREQKPAVVLVEQVDEVLVDELERWSAPRAGVEVLGQVARVAHLRRAGSNRRAAASSQGAVGFVAFKSWPQSTRSAPPCAKVRCWMPRTFYDTAGSRYDRHR